MIVFSSENRIIEILKKHELNGNPLRQGWWLLATGVRKGLFNRSRFPLGGDDNILELGRGGSSTTL